MHLLGASTGETCATRLCFFFAFFHFILYGQSRWYFIRSCQWGAKREPWCTISDLRLCWQLWRGSKGLNCAISMQLSVNFTVLNRKSSWVRGNRVECEEKSDKWSHWHGGRKFLHETSRLTLAKLCHVNAITSNSLGNWEKSSNYLINR